MKEHTKEPWVHNGDGTIWHTQRCGGQLGRFYREGDAIRIVACVNACAGIPAEQLERGGLEMPLLSTLADIRTTLGVGDKPMLSELAGIARTRMGVIKILERDAKGHVANPVKKRADVEIQQIERVRIAAIGNVPLSLSAWSAWWVYLDAVIHDVVCCWPGGRAQCWLSLDAAVEAVAREMLRMAGGEGEEAGGGLYEQAMEVVGWV